MLKNILIVDICQLLDSKQTVAQMYKINTSFTDVRHNYSILAVNKLTLKFSIL